MNVLSTIRSAPMGGVALIDERADLPRFTQPQCAAAIWRRQLAPEIPAWLDGLAPDRLPRGRIVLPAGAIADTVEGLCARAETPEAPERDLLVQDIAMLAEAFSDLMGVALLRLRLDAVTTNACRKFHVDALHARLVCTYRGTGTQYGTSVGGQDPQRVFTVPTGAPILLRGSLWPERPASGLRHRSPPIEGTGETRLVLVLDPIFDPEEAM